MRVLPFRDSSCTTPRRFFLPLPLPLSALIFAARIGLLFVLATAQRND
jgi:hypothetical protein